MAASLQRFQRHTLGLEAPAADRINRIFALPITGMNDVASDAVAAGDATTLAVLKVVTVRLLPDAVKVALARRWLPTSVVVGM